MQAALQSFAASEAYKRSSAALAAPVLRMQDILRQPPRREQLEKVNSTLTQFQGMSDLDHPGHNDPLEQPEAIWILRMLD